MPLGEPVADLVPPVEREKVGVPVLVLLLDTLAVLVLLAPPVRVPVVVPVEVLVEVAELVSAGEEEALLEEEEVLVEVWEVVVVLVLVLEG